MLVRIATAALALALFALPPVAGRAGDSQAVGTLTTLFSTPKLDPSLFAPNFLEKIPVTDVEAFIGSYEARLGNPTSIVPSGFLYLITSPKGSIKANIAFDQQGHISSLLFQDELSDQNLEALTRVLSADTISPDWFHPSYLKDVPLTKTNSMLADMHTALGKFVRVDTNNHTYIAVFEKGETHAQISTDIDDKINYLEFSKPPPPAPAASASAAPAH